jgi:SH3-like domain-containing protein
MKRALAILILLAAPIAHAQVDSSILNPSGLPIPRYVSLKSAEVNVRVGPGKRYPIRYVYKRMNLPVQVVEEFAHWRKIADYEGASGWVHKGMIDGKRTAIMLQKTQTLYAKPDTTSTPIIRAAKLVIAQVHRCEPNWCELEINQRTGWIRKADIWGVAQEEVFEE